MKTIWKPYLYLVFVILGMGLLANAAEEPKKKEANVSAILRAKMATDLASEIAKQLGLKQSSQYSNASNDLEGPTVDFRAFTVSFTIDNASGNRNHYPFKVAKSIASSLKDMGAMGGNLESYFLPTTPEIPEPRIHYRRGNVQGFVMIQMSHTQGNKEGVSIVCYEHVIAESGIAELTAPLKK